MEKIRRQPDQQTSPRSPLEAAHVERHFLSPQELEARRKQGREMLGRARKPDIAVEAALYKVDAEVPHKKKSPLWRIQEQSLREQIKASEMIGRVKVQEGTGIFNPVQEVKTRVKMIAGLSRKLGRRIPRARLEEIIAEEYATNLMKYGMDFYERVEFEKKREERLVDRISHLVNPKRVTDTTRRIIRRAVNFSDHRVDVSYVTQEGEGAKLRAEDYRNGVKSSDPNVSLSDQIKSESEEQKPDLGRSA